MVLRNLRSIFRISRYFLFFYFLLSVACSVGISKIGDEEHIVTEGTFHMLCIAFLNAMNDYTTDSRGDVGAWYVDVSRFCSSVSQTQALAKSN